MGRRTHVNRRAMKKIYTIIILLFSLITRRKKHVLTFVAEHNGPIKRWYYKFPHWGFSHDNLEMVSGADTLCEKYAEGKDEITVEVISTNKLDDYLKETHDFYEGLNQEGGFFDKIQYGRNYQNVSVNKEGNIVINNIWICPVTLFVLGRYPDYLYIKKS